MNPSELKAFITVYDPLPASANERGFIAPDLRPVWSGRARKTFASTREVWAAQAAKTRNVVNFKIRGDTKARAIRVGMRLECAGQRYEIIALQETDALPPEMILKTTLKEAR